jgi:hypothetical protein
MWERSVRHNPLSFRYQNYKDNRPVLAHDNTLDWISGRHTDHKIFYYLFNKKFYICSNNLPVAEKAKLNTLIELNAYFFRCLGYVALVPTVFLSGALFKVGQLPYKILYPIAFLFLWKINSSIIKSNFEVLFENNISYYYYKYRNLEVDTVEKVKDPRRQHFRLDTNVYYRQTPQDLLHSQHGHGDHGGDHHDTSDYYGPYPVNNNYIIILVQ